MYEYGVDGASQIPDDGTDKTKGYSNRNGDLWSGTCRYRKRCSNNPCNVVSATMNGLMQLRTAEEAAAVRGKTAKEILG